MKAGAPVPQRIIHSRPATSRDGATFREIVRYVAKRMRWTEVKASMSVRYVLASGIAFNKIERTWYGRYRLLQPKPPGLVCKVKDTKTSTEEEPSSGCTSESE